MRRAAIIWISPNASASSASLIVHELRRRIDLDPYAARKTRLGELFEALGCLTFRRGRSYDVRELDDVRLALGLSRFASAAARDEAGANDGEGSAPRQPQST